MSFQSCESESFFRLRPDYLRPENRQRMARLCASRVGGNRGSRDINESPWWGTVLATHFVEYPLPADFQRDPRVYVMVGQVAAHVRGEIAYYVSETDARIFTRNVLDGVAEFDDTIEAVCYPTYNLVRETMDSVRRRLSLDVIPVSFRRRKL